MGLTLSEAFKKAWSIIKGRVITTKVKGVTYGIGQKALEHLTHYANDEITILLNREAANLYDSNAIEVYT